MKSKRSKEIISIEEADSKSFCKEIEKVWKEYGEKKGGNLAFDKAGMNALASNTECRLRRVVQEALKFAMHSKRPGVLKEGDIRRALKVTCEKPVEGYLPIQLSDDDDDDDDDEEENEDKIVRLADLKAPPRPGLITIGRHWLAIEGVQPMVSQNPHPETIAALSSASLPLSVQVQQDEARSTEKMSEPPAKVQKTEVEGATCILTEELKSLYEKVCASITDGKEYLEYLEKYTDELFDNTATQQILPYLIQFIVGEVKRGGLHNITERCKIIALLGKIVCPEANLQTSAIFIPSSSSSSSSSSGSFSTGQAPREHFYIEPYLYQLVQIAIACITTKDTRDERESARCPGLAARKDASHILSSLCRCGYTYEGQVVSKVVTALAHVAENGSKPPLSRFGAICALSLLGSDAFNECGMNGTRDVSDACVEDKGLAVDVKALVLNEFKIYIQKSLAETTDAEQQNKLQDLEGFVCDKIEGMKQKDETSFMSYGSENQFI